MLCEVFCSSSTKENIEKGRVETGEREGGRKCLGCQKMCSVKEHEREHGAFKRKNTKILISS